MELKEIYEARDRIKPFIFTTPLIDSFLLRQKTNKNVWLKLETQLPTGTFKPRAAFNSILAQLESAREKGVICSSSGNFAQGAAYAARTLGVSIIVVMMSSTSSYKINRTKELGAEVVICGDSFEERIQTTLKLQKETGRLLIHPYDSYETMAGDGTIALELQEQLGDRLNDDMSILVPISGGGLIAGIAYTLKTLQYRAKIIGVQPSANIALMQSLKENHLVKIPMKHTTIADALASPSVGAKNFPLIRDYVDDVFLVDEEAIQNATDFLIEQHKLVVEPSSAITVAALFSQQIATQNVVCILSGGNINLLK